MPCKFVYGIQEINAVVMPGPDDFHGQWKVYGELPVPAAEHVKVIAEVPCLFAAVPFPVGIRIWIVPECFIFLRIRFFLYMVSDRGGMGYEGRTVAGYCKAVHGQQAALYGRQDGRKEKDILEGTFRIPGHRDAGEDVIYKRSRGSFFIFFQELAVRSDGLFGLFSILSCRERKVPCVAGTVFLPEAVHEIIVGAEGRELIERGAADQDGEHDRFREDILYPCSKAGTCIRPVKEEGEQDHRAQDLCLVDGRPAERRIEIRNITANGIKVEVQEFHFLDWV